MIESTEKKTINGAYFRNGAFDDLKFTESSKNNICEIICFWSKLVYTFRFSA